MNRRRMFQTLALAPVGALLSQEEAPVKVDPETVAATEFLRVGNRAFNLLKTDDAVRNRDARVEASTAFASLNLFLTPEVKKQMGDILHSYESWWPNIEKLPDLYRRYGVYLGTDDEVKAMFRPDIQYREPVITLLDSVGMDAILACMPQILHPDLDRFLLPNPKGARYASQLRMAACGANQDAFDIYYALGGTIAAGMGSAAMMGCVPCGAVAAGMGVGMGLMKAIRAWDCYREKK